MTVHTLKNIQNSPGVEYYGHCKLLATLCVFQPLLNCDLHQTSTERSVKPAVVRDVCGAKTSLPLHYLNLTG